MTKHAPLLPPPSWGRVGVGVVLSAARFRQAEPPRPHPNPPPPRGRELQRALRAPYAIALHVGGGDFSVRSSSALAELQFRISRTRVEWRARRSMPAPLNPLAG